MLLIFGVKMLEPERRRDCGGRRAILSHLDIRGKKQRSDYQ